VSFIVHGDRRPPDGRLGLDADAVVIVTIGKWTIAGWISQTFIGNGLEPI
jgi:hypothetical protein